MPCNTWSFIVLYHDVLIFSFHRMTTTPQPFNCCKLIAFIVDWSYVQKWKLPDPKGWLRRKWAIFTLDVKGAAEWSKLWCVPVWLIVHVSRWKNPGLPYCSDSGGCDSHLNDVCEEQMMELRSCRFIHSPLWRVRYARNPVVITNILQLYFIWC